MRRITPIASALLFSIVTGTLADQKPPPAGGKASAGTGLYADNVQLVAETHKSSLHLRGQSLRRTIARDSCWPGGAWGDTLWVPAALQMNEKTDEANARLLQRAQEYIAQKQENDPDFVPGQTDHTPWAYFALTDYVRILYLFHGKSPHLSGRLAPETEAAMKEALWLHFRASTKLLSISVPRPPITAPTSTEDSAATASRRPSVPCRGSWISRSRANEPAVPFNYAPCVADHDIMKPITRAVLSATVFAVVIAPVTTIRLELNRR
jgi:hypothetical protein